MCFHPFAFSLIPFFPGADIRASQSKCPFPWGEKTSENKVMFCEHRVCVKVALLHGPALGKWKSFCPCARGKRVILFGQGNCPNLSVLCFTLLVNSIALVHVPGEGGKRRESLKKKKKKLKKQKRKLKRTEKKIERKKKKAGGCWAENCLKKTKQRY